jgi:hypothetical protein
MKQKQLLFILVGVIVLMLGGQLSTPIQRARLQQEIAQMQRRGYTVKFLDNNLVELTEPMTGARRMWSLSMPRDQNIRAWASQRGIPILDIDPWTIDTMQFISWFRYAGRVPNGMGAGVDELVLGDIDGNGKTEVYGHTRGFIFDGNLVIYEATTDSTATWRYAYEPYPGKPVGFADVDRDSLIELVTMNYVNVAFFSFFEQPTISGLPTEFRFTFPTTTVGGETGFIPLFGLFDGDSRMDCLFRTIDTDPSGRTARKIAVAEYDTVNYRLQRVWDQALVFLGMFCKGDFDQDGTMGFATTTGFSGSKLVVFENNGDNSYRETYRDSTSFVNHYAIASGDVDGDGTPEIFSEANMETDWVIVHEADSNDRFSPKLLIHFSTGSGFGLPLYLVRAMEGNGRQDLILTTGSYIVILEGNGNDSYRVKYIRRETRLEGMQVADFNNDGRKDLAISSFQHDSLSRTLNYFTTLYLNSRATDILEQQEEGTQTVLLQIFPNPANPATTIEYSIPTSADVKLVLYDLLGRKVQEISSGFQQSGLHRIELNMNGLSSGIYLFQLQAGSSQLTQKLILAR